MKVFLELEVADDAKLMAAAQQLYMQGKVSQSPNSVEKAVTAVLESTCTEDVGLRVYACDTLPPDDMGHTYDVGRFKRLS